MTYNPTTFYNTGEYFFRQEGYLTGLVPLHVATSTIPAFDDENGTALVITDSVAASGAAAAASWAGWDFAESTKILALAYVHSSTSNYIGVGVNVATLPATTLVDSYQSTYDGQVGYSELGKYDSGSLTPLQTTTSIFQNDVTTSSIWGIAIYLDGTANTQQTFIQSAGSWFPVLADTDSTHSSFQSFYLRHFGENCRFMCPISVWGA